jgi:hypothetical protein
MITRLTCYSAVLLIAQAALPQQPAGQPPKQLTNRTKVVLLGTGQPAPDPDRSGPATAIVVDDSAYLVDFGPGVVRRAKAAVLDRHITALEPANLKVAFATHLHSDHTVGYPDLILTGWTAGRRTPLEVYGPTGLQSMTDHILQAWRIDIATRTNPDGLQRGIPDGWKVNAHEIKSGVVYKDAKVAVTGFPTKHAMESYGTGSTRLTAASSSRLWCKVRISITKARWPMAFVPPNGSRRQYTRPLLGVACSGSAKLPQIELSFPDSLG